MPGKQHMQIWQKERKLFKLTGLSWQNYILHFFFFYLGIFKNRFSEEKKDYYWLCQSMYYYLDVAPDFYVLKVTIGAG